MKTTTLCLLAALVAASPLIAVPALVNYQGYLTDTNGNPLGSGAAVNRKLLFRAYDSANAGTRLWTEEHTVTIAEGRFSVLLGNGINPTGTAAGETRPNINTVFNSGGDRYIGITVDNGDGAFNASDTEIAPRQRITSSVYALRAGAAESVASGGDLSLGTDNGLGYYDGNRKFNGIGVNGPVLYGTGGGALGASNSGTQTTALRWQNNGNVSVSNALSSGSLSTSGNASVGGTLSVAGATTLSGVVTAHTGATSPPDIGVTGGAGTRLVLWPGEVNAVPYALGIDGSTLWNSVPGSAKFRWYGGTTKWLELNGGNGQLTALGGLSVAGPLAASGGASVAGGLSVSGEVIAGGIRLPASNFLDPEFVGTAGNSISFGHGGVSEDFIGYKNNTFYLRDALGGGDVWHPSLDVGGNIVAGGDMRLSDAGTLYLRTGADLNHGLTFNNNSFASQSTDGPVLFGFGGGILGSKNTAGASEAWALKWDSGGNVEANSSLKVKGKHVPNAEEALRMIRGTIRGVPSGGVVIEKGNGFAAGRYLAGNPSPNYATYQVTFSQPFSDSPSVTANFNRNTGGQFDNQRLFVTIYDAQPTGFTMVVMTDGGGFDGNATLSFIAIGPR